MPKIVVHPMERSLPTSVAYRSDRITSFSFEDPRLGADGLPDSAALAAIRAAQLADIDAQEASLRARFDMPQPRPSPLQEPGGDFQTADQLKAQAAAHVAAGIMRGAPANSLVTEAPKAARTTPPPDAMRDVLDGTVDELRRLAGQLQAAGDTLDVAPPATEADAQALLATLRARLFDLRRGAAPAQPAAPPPASKPSSPASAQTYVKPDGTPFRAGSTLAAGDRKCGHEQHGVRTPQPIPSVDWDTSNRVYGRPLCQAHMAEARRAAATKPVGR